LPAFQAKLLGRIHLPDIVRLVSPQRLRSRPTAGGSGRLPVTTEIALQGAFAGQQRLGVRLPQADADVASPPTGMELSQSQGLVEKDRVEDRGSAWSRGVIRSELRRGAAEPLQ
jgi:hypothetical protein